MVVVCPECGTRFSLPESRVSGSTANVRCSRCRQVFRITREGQVVGQDLATPEKYPKEPSPREVVQGQMTAPAEPEISPEDKAIPEDKTTPQPAPTPEEPSPLPEKRWSILWLPALLLAAVLMGVLVWRAWQGDWPGLLKPLADQVQRLKGQRSSQPAPAPGPPTGEPAPPPTVVTPSPPPAPAQDLIDLPVDWAQARYQGLVNDKGGGQLLLIYGEVFNKGDKPRGPVRIQAILTDSQHQPLKEEIVYAGTTLTDAELKSLKPGEIKSWLAKPGGRSQETVLKPGDKQPFTVVFFGVHDNLAETQSGFQLVVVEGPVITK